MENVRIPKTVVCKMLMSHRRVVIFITLCFGKNILYFMCSRMAMNLSAIRYNIMSLFAILDIVKKQNCKINLVGPSHSLTISPRSKKLKMAFERQNISSDKAKFTRMIFWLGNSDFTLAKMIIPRKCRKEASGAKQTYPITKDP